MRSLLFLVLLVAALKTDQIHCEPVDAAANAIGEMNRYRRLYAVPFLNESAELKKGAEAYAQHLATLNVKDQQLHEDMLKEEDYIPLIDHTDYPPSDPHNTKYTENICEFKHPRISFPIEYWTTKGGSCYKHKYRAELCKTVAEKFTALYWRSSTEVGVGLAQKHKTKGDKKRWIMVIRFSPPGNQPGAYRENVFLEQEEDTTYETPGWLSSGERPEPVSWIYVVLFIQNYLLINWLTRITN